MLSLVSNLVYLNESVRTYHVKIYSYVVESCLLNLIIIVWSSSRIILLPNFCFDNYTRQISSAVISWRDLFVSKFLISCIPLKHHCQIGTKVYCRIVVLLLHHVCSLARLLWDPIVSLLPSPTVLLLVDFLLVSAAIQALSHLHRKYLRNITPVPVPWWVQLSTIWQVLVTIFLYSIFMG